MRPAHIIPSHIIANINSFLTAYLTLMLHGFINSLYVHCKCYTIIYVTHRKKIIDILIIIRVRIEFDELESYIYLPTKHVASTLPLTIFDGILTQVFILFYLNGP